MEMSIHAHGEPMTPEMQVPHPRSWTRHFVWEWGFCSWDYTEDFGRKRWSWVRVEPRGNPVSLQEGGRWFENRWEESAVVMETESLEEAKSAALKVEAEGHKEGMQETHLESWVRHGKGLYPGARPCGCSASASEPECCRLTLRTVDE